MHWLPSILILPYLFLLLRIYRSLLKIQKFNEFNSPTTFVSVIVACRNEQENLPGLFKSIDSQDYPIEFFEVIVVNDNSSDRTFEVVSGYTGKSKIIAINNKGNGKKHAIRTGIYSASGNFIITTDADCRMGEKWLSTIAAFYESHKPDMIVGPVQIGTGKGFFRRFQELEFLSLQGITAGSVVAGEATMCNGANLSFTREAYLNNADNLHFEINSGDDIFLMHSLKKTKGSKILWLESYDTMAITASSPSLLSFLMQRKRWISKGMAYNDRYTIILGIVTFVTILLQLTFLVAGFFNKLFISLFLVTFLLKSLPDFLILMNTMARYRKRKLMGWFLPAQIVYPIYVIGVFLFSIISPEKKRN